jgi:hypothetical protein
MAADDKTAKTISKEKAPAKEKASAKEKTPSETAAKAEAKTEPKVEPKAESKSEPSANYSRGEGQKPVTQAYKDNWDAIFGKKKKKS